MFLFGLPLAALGDYGGIGTVNNDKRLGYSVTLLLWGDRYLIAGANDRYGPCCRAVSGLKVANRTYELARISPDHCASMRLLQRD